MAKKKTIKTAARKPSDLPPRPPADLAEAVLFGALSEITPELEADYVAAIYRTKNVRLTTKIKNAQMRAILMMATVGFSFVNWQKGRTVI